MNCLVRYFFFASSFIEFNIYLEASYSLAFCGSLLKKLVSKSFCLHLIDTRIALVIRGFLRPG